MVPDLPKIPKVERTRVSPWLEIVTRHVSFSRKAAEETYYAIAQPDYVAVLAVTPDSRVLLVRQYRPAIERSYQPELSTRVKVRWRPPSASFWKRAYRSMRNMLEPDQQYDPLVLRQNR